jgi:hypothetical protein
MHSSGMHSYRINPGIVIKIDQRRRRTLPSISHWSSESCPRLLQGLTGGRMSPRPTSTIVVRSVHVEGRIQHDAVRCSWRVLSRATYLRSRGGLESFPFEAEIVSIALDEI